MKIVVANGHRSLRFPHKESRRVVRAVLAAEKTTIAEVSIVFTDNRRIRSVNRMFLNHNYATDVLAFELERTPNREAEIYVSLDKAKAQAKLFNVPFREETRRLLIHGLLHVLGYQDTSTRRKGAMTRREDQILFLLTQKHR
jgi:rRNA maturation RNase YbeY